MFILIQFYPELGDTVILHLTVSHFNNISAFKYLIQFDTTVLTFISITNINYAINGLNYSKSHDSLSFSWNAGDGSDLNIDSSAVLDMIFIYKGGNCSVEFLPISSVENNNFDTLTVLFKNGIVSLCSPPEIIFQPFLNPAGPFNISDYTWLTGLTITAGNLTYQWYKIYDGITTKLNYWTDAILRFDTLYASDAGCYYCVITNTCGFENYTVTSNATCFLVDDLEITKQPEGGIKHPGDAMTFTITATDTITLGTIKYQWCKNNIPITSETKTIYTISSVVYSSTGYYTCEVWDDADDTLTSYVVALLVDSTNCPNYNPNDHLIPSHSQIVGTGPYSNLYHQNWSCLPNGKQMNADRPMTNWTKTKIYYPTNNAMIDIAYNSPNLEITNTYSNNTYKYSIDSYDKVEINITGEDYNYADSNNIITIKVNGNGKAIPYDTIAKDTINNDFNFNNSTIDIINKNSTYAAQFMNISPFPLENKNSNITVNLNTLNLYALSDSLDSINRFSFITIEGCKKVNVRDCGLQGDFNMKHYLLDIFACDSIFIDKVEIYSMHTCPGTKGGGGIRVNPQQLNSANYKIPAGCSPAKWIVIQDCYFHDYYGGCEPHHDVPGLASDDPANGIVFNCYFENWSCQGLDYSFRGYQDTANITRYYDSTYLSRIERNIFDNCYFAKIDEGPSDSTSGFTRPVVYCTNNMYVNTSLNDYQANYDAFKNKSLFT